MQVPAVPCHVRREVQLTVDEVSDNPGRRTGMAALASITGVDMLPELKTALLAPGVHDDFSKHRELHHEGRWVTPGRASHAQQRVYPTDRVCRDGAQVQGSRRIHRGGHAQR